jgi:hypothetical protein
VTTPAEVIARCRYAEIRIGKDTARLDPIVDDKGRLNSLQSASPPTARGGYVLVIVEAVHGDPCAALAGGACDCGAQKQLEGFVFGA